MSRQKYPAKICGVDFSGSQNAGKHIWVTSGSISNNRLIVNECVRADQLPSSGRDRERCFTALRKFIAKQNHAVFGFDFPFGIPLKLMGEREWKDFISSFRDRFPDPDNFRNHCIRNSIGHELKRRTDRESKVPFSPYNLRMYRQTFFGISDVLAPLIDGNSACVLPMQEPVGGKPWMLEVCPASLLKKEGHYVPYKGKGENHQENRKRILNHFFENDEIVVEEQAIFEVVLENLFGDALDSLLAAIITFRSLNQKILLRSPSRPEYKVEGFVYC